MERAREYSVSSALCAALFPPLVGRSLVEAAPKAAVTALLDPPPAAESPVSLCGRFFSRQFSPLESSTSLALPSSLDQT